MGYNSIQGLYDYCGVESGMISTTIMSGFQSLADSMIINITSAPVAGMAGQVEADLVLQMVHRRQLITNPRDGVYLLPEPPKITPEQRRSLICYQPNAFPFDGYNINDKE